MRGWVPYAANNGTPQQTKQQCIQNALQNRFGNFLANNVIPEFSLLSLRDNWRAFAKGSAIKHRSETFRLG